MGAGGAAAAPPTDRSTYDDAPYSYTSGPYSGYTAASSYGSRLGYDARFEGEDEEHEGNASGRSGMAASLQQHSARDPGQWERFNQADVVSLEEGDEVALGFVGATAAARGAAAAARGAAAAARVAAEGGSLTNSSAHTTGEFATCLRR